MIDINDLSNDLSSNPKLFGKVTSLFPVASDKNVITKDLNGDLQKIRIWADQWKMNFKADIVKLAK